MPTCTFGVSPDIVAHFPHVFAIEARVIPVVWGRRRDVPGEPFDRMGAVGGASARDEQSLPHWGNPRQLSLA